MLGKCLDQRYQVRKALSFGGFSQTYLAEDIRRPSHPLCVVKHLTLASEDPALLQEARTRFAREAEILESLGKHDQIPQLLAFFEEDREFFLVQEFIDGTAFSDELLSAEPFSEAAALEFLADVLSILVFIHDQQVIHRDIKPSNLIRRRLDGKMVLIDFGAVKAVAAQAVQSPVTIQIGTPGYIPPEQAAGHPHFNSDLYALGMTVIQALTGKPPEQLVRTDGQRIWQDKVELSRGFATVLERMVCDHYSQRYASARECWEALQQLEQAPTSITRLALPSAQPVTPTEPSLPPLPSLRLLVGAGLTVLLASAGIGFAYFQQQASRAALTRLQALRAQNQYAACRDQAQVWDRALWIDVTLQRQIAELLNQCQTALDLQTIQQARQLAAQGRVVDAIATARQVAKGSSLRADAQELSRTWTNRLLNLGWAQYHAGRLEQAIAYAQAVPSTAPNYAQAQAAIKQWQQDWQQAETQFTRAQLAFDQDQWQEVVQTVQDDPVPSSRFWQAKLTQLAQRAIQAQETEAELRQQRIAETLSRLERDQDQLGRAVLEIVYPQKAYQQTQAISELQARRQGDRVIFEISIATDGWLWLSETITLNWEVDMLAQRHRSAKVINKTMERDRAQALDNYFSGLVPKYL